MKRICMLLLTLLVLPAHADDGAQKLLDCMHANVPPTLRAQQIELSVTDREGTSRKLVGRLYAAPDDKGRIQAMLKIDGPADLAGAAYLVRESDDYLKDGMYVYLPSVRRVRRVSGTFADGALMGTHFSYNDFRQLQTAFAGTPATLEDAEEQIDGRAAKILDFAPAPESRYSKVRVWVDPKYCLPVKADFYEGGKISKELTVPVASPKVTGAYWYLSEIHMRDLKDGSGSILRSTGVSAPQNIPGSNFDPQSFYIGH